MKRGDKAAVVCCSNGQKAYNKGDIERLKDTLIAMGITPTFSPYIYEKEGPFSGTACERARALMDFYEDDEIKAVFDISGGDIANEILPYLDFDIIGQKDKCFWGYSDLTTIINAIYAKTGRPSILYQVRNLIYDNGESQVRDFKNSILNGKEDLFSPEYEFIQGDSLKGIVIGGNIRCFLKLAGTEYLPDFKGKVLLLESYGGGTAQMVTYLSQLRCMGAFREIRGIILGTFTKMEKEGCTPDILELVKRQAGREIPIVRTKYIGHGTDSKAIMIGRGIELYR